MSGDEKTGAEIFSPWYDPEFIQDKTEQKQNAIARMAERGEIRSAADWNDKAKRRFERHWDRLSDETKRSYQSAARHFGRYLGIRKSQAQVSAIVARLIMLSYMEASTLVEEYMMWMETDLELAPNTINVRLAALRWFADAARRVGWVEWKLDVKNVKGGNVRDTEGPTPAEFRRILRVVNTAEGRGAMRNRFMIYMLAFMGVRISSAISLDFENIDFESKRFKVKWKGEGDTVARYIWRPVGPLTFEALQDWLEVRGSDPGPIFCSLGANRSADGRLSVRHAQRIIEDIGREAATRKRLSSHAFRHFHATDALEAEGDTRRVMKSTRHASDRTLLGHYDDSDDTAAREVSASMEMRYLPKLSDLEEEDEKEIASRYDNVEADPDETDLSELGVVTSVDAVADGVTYDRVSTGLPGVDDLLGGKEGEQGIVRGSVVLIGGYPGIGKSTLARQISFNICESNPAERVLYASGEESTEQIGESLKRLECEHKNLLLLSEKSIDRICDVADKLDVAVLIVDSVSTVAVDDCPKDPGSISQVKAIGHYLLRWAKGVGDEGEGSGISVIVISHVDKKGNIAGPKALEHHVDAVFSFMSPSKRSPMRSLGCEGKNRFGDATKEMAFKMTDKGLVEIQLEEDDDW